jgi:hypothetical protein
LALVTCQAHLAAAHHPQDHCQLAEMATEGLRTALFRRLALKVQLELNLQRKHAAMIAQIRELHAQAQRKHTLLTLSQFAFLHTAIAHAVSLSTADQKAAYADAVERIADLAHAHAFADQVLSATLSAHQSVSQFALQYFPAVKSTS